MKMEKFQTFHDVKEVENYFNTRNKNLLENVLANKFLISEGFFRDLDGKDRVTKDIILSETYHIKEDKIQDYKTESPLYTSDQLTSFKSKLQQLQSSIETKGKVYTTRGACGIFGSCCSYFEIYELKYREDENKIGTIIWTSLIHDKILKTISETIKFSNPQFFDKILEIFDGKKTIIIPIPPKNSKSVSCKRLSYSTILKNLNDLVVYDNPLFYCENNEDEIKRSYQLMTETTYTNRHLERRELKEMRGDEYVINLTFQNDLLIGITSPEIENIEYIYFDGNDGVKLPKHGEILYTREKMPYVPISSLPLVLCAMPYVFPRRIYIKPKLGKTLHEIFVYYQNVHDNRDDLAILPHEFRDGKSIIRISDGGIGVVRR